MSDALRFTPDRIAVRSGETVKFVIHVAAKRIAAPKIDGDRGAPGLGCGAPRSRSAPAWQRLK
jgi:plastocyanin